MLKGVKSKDYFPFAIKLHSLCIYWFEYLNCIVPNLCCVNITLCIKQTTLTFDLVHIFSHMNQTLLLIIFPVQWVVLYHGGTDFLIK